jgi:hypothetical protein
MNSRWRWRCMHVERGEQGGGAVPLVVMRHGLAAPGLIGSPGWVRSSAWIWLFSSIDSTTACAGGSTPGCGRWPARGQAPSPTMSMSLAAKPRIARTLERAQPVRLQFVRPPDALHRTDRDADGFGHRPAGPVGRLARRRGARQWHDPRRGFRRDRRLAGLAGLVAQQTLDPALGKARLPPPYRGPADADALRHLPRRVPIRRGKHDARPLHMFARPVAVGHDRRQPLALRSAQNHAYLLSNGRSSKPGPNIADPNAFVNPLNDSNH